MECRKSVPQAPVSAVSLLTLSAMQPAANRAALARGAARVLRRGQQADGLMSMDPNATGNLPLLYPFLISCLPYSHPDRSIHLEIPMRNAGNDRAIAATHMVERFPVPPGSSPLRTQIAGGTIHFDIREGPAVHNTRGDIDLHIASEMKAWLLDRLSKDRIPVDAIQTATLRVGMNTDRIKTDKKRVVSFDWQRLSAISTDEKTYEVELTDRHGWHSRVHPEETNTS